VLNQKERLVPTTHDFIPKVHLQLFVWVLAKCLDDEWIRITALSRLMWDMAKSALPVPFFD